MQQQIDTEKLVAESEALVESARHDLGQASMLTHWAMQVANLANVRERDEALLQLVFDQLHAAGQRPAFNAPAIDLDAATSFARKVWRRRAVV